MRKTAKDIVKKKGDRYKISNLRLDLEAAERGETWKLIPSGFYGEEYPLPARKNELEILAAIAIPPHKNDDGCKYLKRAKKKWKDRAARQQSAVHNIGRKSHEIERKSIKFNEFVKNKKAELTLEIDKAKAEAINAVASLKDLFELGRQGLDAQMRAHLKDGEVNGEKIDARAFRECFRMVTQAVKGLGLPSDQRDVAEEAIMDEVAAALKSTQSITRDEDLN